jgi:hypothetical protein
MIDIAFLILYASLCEYILHGQLMHTRRNLFPYPFISHETVHHRHFRADDTYHAHSKEDRKLVPMAWWNCLVLVPSWSLPILPLSFLFYSELSLWFKSLAVLAAYYGAYEYLHWCMHVPKEKRRMIERLPLIGWVFRYLNGHHILHHRFYKFKGKKWNLNVVLPFWDWVLGTLMVKSPKKFLQVKGPSVPDLQPL